MLTLSQTTVLRAFAAIGRSRWREVAAAGLLFTALTFAVFGWYVSEGGFVADDWVNADKYHFHSEPGFWGAVDNYQTPSRPVAAVYVTSTHVLLGTHFEYHLLLSLLLAAFLSTAFFAFLRALGLDWRLALAAAALLLVFPSSDSTRFWATGSQINLFIGLYLVAATIAIEGRRRFGPAPSVPAVTTQVLASALAVTAVAGYEIVAAAVLLSVLLYGWIGREGAIWRWLFDAIPTVSVLILYTQKFGGGAAQGMQLLTNVRTVADEAVSVLAYTLVPTRELSGLIGFWEISRWTVLWGVVAVVVATLLVRRFAPADPSRDAVGRWLGPPAAGDRGHRDRLRDDRPRSGTVSALRARRAEPDQLLRRPWILRSGDVPVGCDRLDARRHRPAAHRENTSAASPRPHRCAAVGRVRCVHGSHQPRRASMGASRGDPGPDPRRAHDLVPAPPADAVIFTSPFPGFSARSIPILAGGGNNDAAGAFKVTYDSDEMRAYPLLEEVGVTCGPTSMEAPGSDNGEADYGKAIMIDFRTSTVYRPRSRRECVEYTEAMRPFGPVNLSEEW